MLVLSHNVYWFQGEPFEGDKPPAPHAVVLRELCRLYRELAPQVICLQEVQSADAFAMVAEQLDMEGCYCPGIGLPQYGGAVLWHRGRGRKICDARDAAEVEPQRMWQVVEAHLTAGDAELPLLLANAHLPSDRQLSEEAAQLQRAAELEVVLGGRGIVPDLVAGDLNEQPGGNLTALLCGKGYIDAAVETGKASLPASALKQRRNDYLWLRRQSAVAIGEYGVVSRERMDGAAAGKRFLSDHLPVWARLVYTSTDG